MMMAVDVARNRFPYFRRVIPPTHRPICSPTAIAELREKVVKTQRSRKRAEQILVKQSQSVHADSTGVKYVNPFHWIVTFPEIWMVPVSRGALGAGPPTVKSNAVTEFFGNVQTFDGH